MKRFVLTARAKQDINDIWDYIAADSLEDADRVLDALETRERRRKFPRVFSGGAVAPRQDVPPTRGPRAPCNQVSRL